MRSFWKPWLAGLWALVLVRFFVLMYGNVAGLTQGAIRTAGAACR